MSSIDETIQANIKKQMQNAKASEVEPNNISYKDMQEFNSYTSMKKSLKYGDWVDLKAVQSLDELENQGVTRRYTLVKVNTASMILKEVGSQEFQVFQWVPAKQVQLTEDKKGIIFKDEQGNIMFVMYVRKRFMDSYYKYMNFRNQSEFGTLPEIENATNPGSKVKLYYGMLSTKDMNNHTSLKGMHSVEGIILDYKPEDYIILTTMDLEKRMKKLAKGELVEDLCFSLNTASGKWINEIKDNKEPLEVIDYYAYDLETIPNNMTDMQLKINTLSLLVYNQVGRG